MGLSWEEGGDGALKVEEFDRVGFGWTGPMARRRVFKAISGSEASRVMAGFVSYSCTLLLLL